MQYQFKGCQECCPLCRRQCDVQHKDEERPNERKHNCMDGHQIQGFGGNIEENTNNAVLVSCGEMDDNYDVNYKDSSGSMEGSRWNELMKAVKDFIEILEQSKNLKENSVITAITYNHQIKNVFKKETPSIQLLEKIDFLDGGTNFENPLQETYNVIQQCLNEYDKYVVCLMTDGEAPHPKNAIKLFNSNQQIMKKLMFTALYYETNNSNGITYTSNRQNLEKIAIEMKGSIKQALTAEQLKKEFQGLIPNIYEQ